MSRIEQALEKAARLRGPLISAEGATATGARPRTFDPAVFRAPEGGVQEDSVDRHIVCITTPDSAAAEEYRKLKARIFKTTEKDFLNTLMVTSSQAGEGKSVTALNLAVAVAHELDRTVLLVDADLRKPRLHAYLGLKPQYGLSDYLLGEKDLPGLLVKTGIGKLVFLPAGRPPSNPAELIASERMRELVRELKQRYADRYVIFDSSPLLMAADALSLCDYVDGMIFVVQAARTTPKVASQALAVVRNYNILGTVFNNVSKDLAREYYPYYYQESPPAPESGAGTISEGRNDAGRDAS